MKKEKSQDKSTMDRIIDAAIPLFAMKGYAAVSVKELAQAADVNVALISYYFGGKENLYVSILKDQFASISELIDILRKEDVSSSDKIRHFGAMSVKIHKQCPYTSYLVYGEIINPTVSFDNIVKKEIFELHHFLSECISQAVAIGEFRSDLEPTYAAFTLTSIIHFYFFTQHLSKGTLPSRADQAEYYIAQAIETYLHGVLAPRDLLK
ncbi:TetR family transcriptional regulator [Pelosinus sp. sgz500959]|uniref:TetR family transcriptional regulator n=1 Tax=Pelosinus sp. sgz500959 TaxID=3242472 RepID=UPI00366D6597